MGYEIVYDKLGIKLPDNKYILLIQSGSNNCWECGLRSRYIPEKSWSAYPIRDSADFPVVTMDEFAQQVDSDMVDYTSVYNNGCLEIFRTRNKPWKAKAFFTWLTNALKRAETVEEISRRHVIEVGTYIKNPSGGYHVLQNKVVIRTTQALLDYIEKAKKTHGYAGIHWNLPRNITHPRKNPQNIKKVPFFFAIQDQKNSFYVKKTPHALHLAPDVDSARKFTSENLAQKYIEKFGLRDYGFDSVVRVDAEAYI